MAPELEMSVIVRPLSVEEPRRADEIFIANAVAAVVPAGKFEDSNLSRLGVSKKIGNKLQKRASFYAS